MPLIYEIMPSMPIRDHDPEPMPCPLDYRHAGQRMGGAKGLRKNSGRGRKGERAKAGIKPTTCTPPPGRSCTVESGQACEIWGEIISHH